MNTLEIILPLRNPPDVIERTIASLAAQTDRNFSVLLSDNHSSQGGERIAAAMSQLQNAGLPTRRVRPPAELGRVEHWNWAHYQSAAGWLKPLFAGDWLDPHYIAKVRAAIKANPECRYIFSAYTLHRLDQPPTRVVSAWTGRFFSPREMKQTVLRYGMQFGPPSAAVYERRVFMALGGYPTTLPICSDSLLFCAMSAHFGALGLAEPLCHFNIHGARFSTTLPQKRKDTYFESLTYYLMLGCQAWASRMPFSKIGFARMLLRERRAYRKAMKA